MLIYILFFRFPSFFLVSDLHRLYSLAIEMYRVYLLRLFLCFAHANMHEFRVCIACPVVSLYTAFFVFSKEQRRDEIARNSKATIGSSSGYMIVMTVPRGIGLFVQK